jgi:hypothetical protein
LEKNLLFLIGLTGSEVDRRLIRAGLVQRDWSKRREGPEGKVPTGLGRGADVLRLIPDLPSQYKTTGRRRDLRDTNASIGPDGIFAFELSPRGIWS